jgi:hypothetical protein
MDSKEGVCVARIKRVQAHARLTARRKTISSVVPTEDDEQELCKRDVNGAQGKFKANHKLSIYGAIDSVRSSPFSGSDMHLVLTTNPYLSGGWWWLQGKSMGEARTWVGAVESIAQRAAFCLSGLLIHDDWSGKGE